MTDKDLVVDKLGGTKIIDLVLEHHKLRERILTLISELKNDGGECDCADQETFEYVHYGNHFDEVISVCINCGGIVANDR